MFTINNITNHSFVYECECGVLGKCMFVPVTGCGDVVMDLKCPACDRKERICIKKETNGDDMQWALVLDNDLLGDDCERIT
jgi:hypothetical protein